MDEWCEIANLVQADEALANEVHVWKLCLEPDRLELEALSKLLSEQERMRANRFHFAVHRDRYFAGHGCLRLLLGAYLDVKPEGIQLGTGPNDKPYVEGRRSLHFNFSHSSDVALLAISCAGDVGVDIERERHLSDTADLVQRFFSAAEAELFRIVPEHERTRAFLNLWTRKEALLKATGEGIAHSLNRVEVTFLENQPARILAGAEVLGHAGKWTLEALEGIPNFRAAVAVRAPDVRVRTFMFPRVEQFRGRVEAGCT